MIGPSEKPGNDMPNDANESNETTALAKILFGWTDGKWVGNGFFIVVGLIGICLLATDFIHNRHTHYKAVEFSDTYLFYGFYGFCAFSLVVLSGWPLGKLLRRKENYYDPELPDTDDQDGGHH